MIPWEKDVYIQLLINALEEEKQILDQENI